MKKLWIVFIILALSTAVYAGEEDYDCKEGFNETTETRWHTHCAKDTDTDTDTDTHRSLEDAVGVGVDIPLYEDDNVDVDVEYKRDFNNDVNSTYLVFKPKGWTLFDAVKSLFAKDE